MVFEGKDTLITIVHVFNGYYYIDGVHHDILIFYP